MLWPMDLEQKITPINGVIQYISYENLYIGKKERNKYMKKTDKKDGINVDIRSKESAYITIKTLAGKWTIYVDNSTGEHIIESWQE